MTRNRRSLPRIAKAIKTFEKKTIQNVVEIGKLLHEASEQCEHGVYQAWVEREFSWSYRTAVRYRDVYEFQKCHGVTFKKMNFTQSALYLVAGMKGDDEQKARKAIINTAKRRRVTYTMARGIVEQFEPIEPLPERPPRPPPSFEPPPIEPIDGETSPPDDEETPPTDDGETAPPKPPADAELITALDVVLRYSFRSDAWPKVIEAIGSVKLREIIEALKAVYDTHCDKSAVKTKADRAEAKAARIIARRHDHQSMGRT